MESCRPTDVNLPFFIFGGLQGALLNHSPHSRQKLTCSHGKQIFLSLGGKSSSFQRIPLSEEATPLFVGEERWLASAIRSGYSGEHLAELMTEQHREQTSIFSLIQDEDLEEYIVMIGKSGFAQISSLESLLKKPLVPFEGGYGVEVGIPPEIGAGTFCLKVWPTVAHLPPLGKEEENIPAVHVCFSEAENRSEVLSLVYDPAATSLMWPLFEGRYRVRYQPMETESGCIIPVLVCAGILYCAAVIFCVFLSRESSRDRAGGDGGLY
jgi:hypothetical protein